MEPKSFYYTYLANNDIFGIDEYLTDLVLDERPQSVFDFGTGTGKNLRLLQSKSKRPITLCGLDLSMLNIMYARAKNDIPFLIVGDEYFLCRISQFEVVMTCSVLCHIKDIDDIINELKRIASKSIIIAETNDVVGEYYYPHDYLSYGFVDLGVEWYSKGNNANYKFYKYERV